MTANAFVNKSAPPTAAELAAALGPAQAAWDQLLRDLATEHKLTVCEWHSYSPKAGWAMRIKHQERNIVYLSPRTGMFLAAFALGDRAVAAALESGFPPPILALIKQAKRYAEGTAIRLEVTCTEEIAVVKQFVAIKLAH